MTANTNAAKRFVVSPGINEGPWSLLSGAPRAGATCKICGNVIAPNVRAFYELLFSSDPEWDRATAHRQCGWVNRAQLDLN